VKQLASGSVNEHLEVAGNPAYPSYIIKGRVKNLMVEAGLNLMGPLFLKHIGEILGSPDRLDYLFLTHSHYDHLGAANYLKKCIPGLVLGAHERVAQLMLKESVLSLMNRLSEVQLPLFPDVGDYGAITIRPMEIALSLKEGDESDLGGLTCRVYEVPGHTKDSLAYYIPEQGMLFTGEAAGVPQGPDGGERQVCFLTSFDDYVASLEKIIAISPRILCIGHAWIFTDEDASRFLSSSYDATFEYRELIERYLHETGGDVEKAVEAMAQREYDEKGTIYQERNAYLTNLQAQVKHIASLRTNC
jgi:2-aminobenzoylacetyl-CoA thioesterase